MQKEYVYVCVHHYNTIQDNGHFLRGLLPNSKILCFYLKSHSLTSDIEQIQRQSQLYPLP